MKPNSNLSNSKSLLGCQNWVTAMGGHHNLELGLMTERRPPSWSDIYSQCSFSMMVRWVKDDVLQANATKIIVNDGKISFKLYKLN